MRVSQGWHYAQIYLISPTQMVPIGDELEVKDGQMPERASRYDHIFRSYGYMRWTHSYGTKYHPNDVEWDGRASTLRRLMVGGWYSENKLPWRFLNRMPGLTLTFTHEKVYRWQNRSYIMLPRLRFTCTTHKIRMRDLFMRILEAGHIDALK